MARRTVILTFSSKKVLEKLGIRIKKARLRRNIRAEELAGRAGISTGTLNSIEKGAASVSIGAYVVVLQVLEMEKDLDSVAMDEEGKRRHPSLFGLERERATKQKGE